jgi:ribosomal protein L11 methyltransferase
MNWIAVEMTLDAAQVEGVAQALMQAGASSVDVSDAAFGSELERPIYAEHGGAAFPAWELNRVTALFPGEIDLQQTLAAAAKLAGCGLPPCRIARVDDRDWVRLTQAQFAPIRVSARLWIVPTWHQPPDPAAINVVLDPGLAFGTGSHATTRLCLRWLDERLRPGCSMIDYGCGSGILAIAARKLGAARVTGVDIDAQALEASRANARLNYVNVEFLDARAAPPEAADVLAANILAAPLKALAPLCSRLVRRGGCLLLSGILEAQAAEVAHAYSPWFDTQVGASDEGWVRLDGLRRSQSEGGS